MLSSVMPKAGEYRLGTSNPVMIVELSITSWCNYRCAYCVTSVHAKRDAAVHAFDRHPVDQWIAAFERIPLEIALLCRGGEPFLDHESFAPFLAAVAGQPKLRYVRVDTNGSWSPDRYATVPRDVRQRIRLNVSFHPTQITVEAFEKKLARIVESGWNVAMINYVMEAQQATDYERVRDHFERVHGIYVNPNPDAFDHRPSARAALTRLLPAIDLARKTGEVTARKPCFFPSIAYFISPDGTAERACRVVVPGQPRTLDFIRDSHTLSPLPTSVSCPLPACLCLDRYAFLDEIETRGRSLDLLGEYVDACRAHQARDRRELT